MKLYVEPGAHINSARERAVQLAITRRSEVPFEFNGVALLATPSSRSQDIVAEFHRICVAEFHRCGLGEDEGGGMKVKIENGKGHGKWNVDHIVPCRAKTPSGEYLFDFTKKEDQLACFNYKNLQPLWEIENIKKGNKYEQIP